MQASTPRKREQPAASGLTNLVFSLISHNGLVHLQPAHDVHEVDGGVLGDDLDECWQGV